MADRVSIWRTPLLVSLMFIASVVLLVSNAVIGYRNTQSLETTSQWIAHSLTAMERLVQLQSLLTDAETGQRGYLLTGDETYLEPYLTAKPKISEEIAALNTLVSENPKQLERLNLLQQLAQQRLTIIESTIIARQAGDMKTVSRIMQSGKVIMDKAREIIRDMGDEERRLYARREGAAQSSSRSAGTSALVTTVVGIIVLAWLYYLIGLYIAHIQRSERALADLNESLEETVRARTADLFRLSGSLINVREEERANIARELHDELGSSLTAIAMEVARVHERLEIQGPDLANRLERVRNMLRSTTELKRRIIEELRPSILDNLGLGPAIESYANDFAERTGIVVEQTLTDDLADLPDHCPIAVFRVFQESLTNVARHSRATRVTVMLERRGEDLILEVIDDGIGIGSRTGANTQSHGILGMRGRVEQLKGNFHIGPGTGDKGTLVRAIIPCPRE